MGRARALRDEGQEGEEVQHRRYFRTVCYVLNRPQVITEQSVLALKPLVSISNSLYCLSAIL